MDKPNITLEIYKGFALDELDRWTPSSTPT